MTGRKEKLLLKPSRYKYGGGDHGIMEYFVEQIARDGAGGLTCMENAIESHLIAFAAETSRREGTVVDLAKLRR